MAAVALWVVFVSVCVGLGYPTVTRYDARSPRLSYDIALYHWQTSGEGDGTPPSRVHFRYRLLVPLVARPFYLLGRGRLGSWDPGFFGLTVSDAAFCATTALLLTLMGLRLYRDRAWALAGGLLYLTSFSVPNFFLAGRIDAGEACLLMAAVWAMDRNRWHWLPAIVVAGVLAKETFALIAPSVAIAWLARSWRELPVVERRRRATWLVVAAVCGLATVTVVFSAATGALVWPWQLESSGALADLDRGFLWRTIRLATDVNLVYAFGWLMPLGIWNLARCPAPWIWGAAGGVMAVVATGAYNGEPGVARSLFTVAGPLLTASSAFTLQRLVGADELALPRMADATRTGQPRPARYALNVRRQSAVRSSSPPSR